MALEIIDKAMKKQKDRPDLSYNSLEKRLRPWMPCIQRNLQEYLDSALETDQALPRPGTVLLSGLRLHTEFSASDGSLYDVRLPAEKKSIQDLDKTMDDLYCCGDDIKLLWKYGKGDKQLETRSRL